MTDPYGNQWPEASPANAQPSLAPLPAGQVHPNPAGNSGATPRDDYASWGNRVRARLIDQTPTYLGLIIFCAGYLILIIRLVLSGGSSPDVEGAAVTMIVGLSVMAASLVWVAYNRWLTTGRTGQSLGKRVTKIKLVGIDTDAPISPRNAFIRDLVHILDALTLMGYLWPLWDDKKQTFGDQIMKTIVINSAVDAPDP
jgi:uncharacterized RDD family membrane protein YckC